MNRRELIITAMAASTLTSGAGALAGSSPRARRVTFMLGEFSNVMDVGGPWEVFQDAMGSAGGDMLPLFNLSTVARTMSPVSMTGGMRVVPDYDITTVPPPDIIVVPAQKTDPQLLAWLAKASSTAEITMSICTGAFQLGRAGLLAGRRATTHHDSWDSFEREFKTTTLERGPRFVDSGRIVTAGGLTSGIDAALHVIERLHGMGTAGATATFMEYSRRTPA